MRFSSLFSKTILEPPKDADSINAKLLIQAGFIARLAAGIYTLLPLGMRVLTKINRIIREEMNRLDGQEILMPVLHPRELWEQTGRDKSMNEVLYRTKASGDRHFILGPSHEETVTPLIKKFIRSYRDLPISVYQLQTKFRDEPRAKSGLLRGREFGMKDMYSFHANEKDLDQYYERVKKGYLQVFERCGLQAYVIEASGGAFSKKYSHEFSIITPEGEDTILLCESCKYGQNIEIAEAFIESPLKESNIPLQCPICRMEVKEIKAIEAGNIFKLGTKFSEIFDLMYADEKGQEHLIVMGCYGLGTTRLIGTIVETSHDAKGIIWPSSVAPYTVHLLNLGKEQEVKEEAEKVYKKLRELNVEVLYDDRDESAGKKLADADLIGIPLRIVVSKKTLEKKEVEIKKRSEKEAKMLPYSQLATGNWQP